MAAVVCVEMAVRGHNTHCPSRCHVADFPSGPQASLATRVATSMCSRPLWTGAMVNSAMVGWWQHLLVMEGQMAVRIYMWMLLDIGDLLQYIKVVLHRLEMVGWGWFGCEGSGGLPCVPLTFFLLCGYLCEHFSSM